MTCRWPSSVAIVAEGTPNTIRRLRRLHRLRNERRNIGHERSSASASASAFCLLPSAFCFCVICLICLICGYPQLLFACSVLIVIVNARELPEETRPERGLVA